MSDMNKLLEEDLIDELELAFNQKLFVAKEKYPYRVERILQALAQLKQIVEQHFEVQQFKCPTCRRTWEFTKDRVYFAQQEKPKSDLSRDQWDQVEREG